MRRTARRLLGVAVVAMVVGLSLAGSAEAVVSAADGAMPQTKCQDPPPVVVSEEENDFLIVFFLFGKLPQVLSDMAEDLDSFFDVFVESVL